MRLCVKEREGEMIARSIHGGEGPHQGPKKLAKQIKRQVYYWLSLHQKVRETTIKCDECKRHNNVQRAPSTTLSTIVTLLPFTR